MKMLTLTLALLASLPAFSAQYSCVAGRSESINLNVKVEENLVTVNFQKATGPAIAADLNTKSVKMNIDEERTADARGWKIYTGKILVNKTFDEYRHFELSINPKTPNGSSTLVGNFSLSPRGSALWPSYLSQYDLNCQLVK